MTHKAVNNLQPYSPSLPDFCRFLEKHGTQANSSESIAELWESQAEALRIDSKDANVETIDMLLNTMLTTLSHLAEVEKQQRWSNRMKAFFRARPKQAASLGSKSGEALLHNV